MKTAFKKCNWDRLLTEIEEQKVIPVIGSELLEIEVDGVLAGFYDHLARQLADCLEVDEDKLSEGYDLSEVTNQYILDNNDPADIYYEIRQIITSRQWPVPIPLQQLAEIRHFDVYLSLTFDPFMKQALDQIRFDGNDRTAAYAFSNMGGSIDLPTDTSALTEPVVYHLFGRVSSSPDYAVTEDDILRFNHLLQSKEFRPKNLFDLLKNRNLLTLGCNFPDWLSRFFYCAAKGDLLFSSMGMRGVVADNSTKHDQELSRFISRSKTLLYQQGNGPEFIAKLHKLWMARFGNANDLAFPDKNEETNDQSQFPEEGIFLSYASEDRPAALKIKEALESNGLDVWFDQKQLEAGDDYKQKIFRNIENCSYFLPVLSKHTVSMDRRFFRLEWNKALEEQQFRPQEYPFIQPIVIDDTTPDAPYIPDEFKARHWQHFPAGQVPPDFIELTRSRVRNLRREKRGLR